MNKIKLIIEQTFDIVTLDSSLPGVIIFLLNRVNQYYYFDIVEVEVNIGT